MCARDLLPSTYGVEAFARTFAPEPDWAAVGLDLARVRGRRGRLAGRRDVGVPAGGGPVTAAASPGAPGTMCGVTAP